MQGEGKTPMRQHQTKANLGCAGVPNDSRARIRPRCRRSAGNSACRRCSHCRREVEIVRFRRLAEWASFSVRFFLPSYWRTMLRKQAPSLDRRRIARSHGSLSQRFARGRAGACIAGVVASGISSMRLSGCGASSIYLGMERDSASMFSIPATPDERNCRWGAIFALRVTTWTSMGTRSAPWFI